MPPGARQGGPEGLKGAGQTPSSLKSGLRQLFCEDGAHAPQPSLRWNPNPRVPHRPPSHRPTQPVLSPPHPLSPELGNRGKDQNLHWPLLLPARTVPAPSRGPQPHAPYSPPPPACASHSTPCPASSLPGPWGQAAARASHTPICLLPDPRPRTPSTAGECWLTLCPLPWAADPLWATPRSRRQDPPRGRRCPRRRREKPQAQTGGRSSCRASDLHKPSFFPFNIS